MFASSPASIFCRWLPAFLGIMVLTTPRPTGADIVASNGTPIGYEAAIREAISWHPSIIEANFRLKQQEQNIAAARSQWMPQINAGISSGYTQSAVRQSWSPRGTVSLEQRIWDFGKISTEVAAAQADFRAHEIQVLQSVDSIALEVVLALIEIHRSHELLKAARAQLASVGSISTLVEQRHAQGAATRSDALQAQSRVDAARSTILQLEADLTRSLASLASYLGRDVAEEIADAPPKRLFNACRTVSVHQANSPALMYAQAQVDKALAAMKRERAEAYPTISLQVNAQTDINEPLGEDHTDYSVGVNVSTSVFNGGITRARIRNSTLGLSAAEAGYRAALTEAERLLAESRAQYAALESRVGSLTQQHEKMQETRELYRLQYLEMGTRTLVDLLNSEQEFTQTRFEAINAEHELARLGANCLYVTGDLRSTFNLKGMVIDGVTL